MALTACRECGEQISTEAKTCPSCGIKSPVRKPIGCLGAVAWVFLICVALGVIGNLSTPATHQDTIDRSNPAIRKKFIDCEKTFERYHKANIIYDIKLDLPPAIYAGPMFMALPIHNKQVVADVANCVFTQGDGMFVDFDILDWQTGKAVGHFHWGKLEMD